MSLLKRIFLGRPDEKVLRRITRKGVTLSITENEDEKILKYNNIIYSRVNKKSVYTNSYWDYFAPLPLLYSSPKMLMIGLGGGTVIVQLNQLFGGEVSLKVVELDKDMIKISKDFLPKGLKNTTINQGDGAKFIKGKNGAYDIIALDAYTGDRIPQVFLQDEFIRDAYEALGDEGVMGINYALNLNALIHMERYLSALRKLFKVYTINNPLSSGNMIILCSKKLDKEQMLEKLNKRINKIKPTYAMMRGYLEMK